MSNKSQLWGERGSGEQRILFIGWSLEPIISNKRQVMSFVCSHGFMVKLWHRPKSNCRSGILPPAVISCVITLHWAAQRGCPSEEAGCGWSGNITLLCIEDIISDALLSLQRFNESNFNSVKQLSSLILWRSTRQRELIYDGFIAARASLCLSSTCLTSVQPVLSSVSVTWGLLPQAGNTWITKTCLSEMLTLRWHCWRALCLLLEKIWIWINNNTEWIIHYMLTSYLPKCFHHFSVCSWSVSHQAEYYRVFNVNLFFYIFFIIFIFKTIFLFSYSK